MTIYVATSQKIINHLIQDKRILPIAVTSLEQYDSRFYIDIAKKYARLLDDLHINVGAHYWRFYFMEGSITYLTAYQDWLDSNTYNVAQK